MTYQGKVVNGVVVFDDGLTPPEGARVRVEPLSEPAQSRAAAGGWAQELLKFAGTAKCLPADLARNHDHYLYGTPKR